MEFIIRNKKLLLWVAVVVIGFTFYNATKVKYCKVEDCPEEIHNGEKYCYIHGCSNFSCKRKAVVDFGYCEKCLKKGMN